MAAPGYGGYGEYPGGSPAPPGQLPPCRDGFRRDANGKCVAVNPLGVQINVPEGAEPFEDPRPCPKGQVRARTGQKKGQCVTPAAVPEGGPGTGYGGYGDPPVHTGTFDPVVDPPPPPPPTRNGDGGDDGGDRGEPERDPRSGWVVCEDGGTAPTEAHCRSWGRSGVARRAPEAPTPSLSQLMMEAPGARVEEPQDFRRRSFGDVLLDPRYVQGAAQQQRALRDVAEASGVRGAPFLAAQTGAQRSLANQLYSASLPEELAVHGRNLDVNRVGWDRAFNYATGQAGVDQRSHGLALQGYGLDAARDQDLWGRWYQPWSLQEANRHALQMQRNQLGYNRWATGQGNALAVWQTLMNPAGFGYYPAYSNPA